MNIESNYASDNRPEPGRKSRAPKQMQNTSQTISDISFELPSDCRGDGFDIALAGHTDDKPLDEPGIIREKIYMNGSFVGYTVYKVGQQVTEAEAKLLPVGTHVTFNRWAAQCYRTVYYRVATYVVTPRKRGTGNYLRLEDAGYGQYPHLGGEYQPRWQGRILV